MLGRVLSCLRKSDDLAESTVDSIVQWGQASTSGICSWEARLKNLRGPRLSEAPLIDRRLKSLSARGRASIWNSETLDHAVLSTVAIGMATRSVHQDACRRRQRSEPLSMLNGCLLKGILMICRKNRIKVNLVSDSNRDCV